jgi:hypothetical protein
LADESVQNELAAYPRGRPPPQPRQRRAASLPWIRQHVFLRLGADPQTQAIDETGADDEAETGWGAPVSSPASPFGR